MSIVEEFLSFVKEQYGITLTAKEGNGGLSFEDLYGYDMSETKGEQE